MRYHFDVFKHGLLLSTALLFNPSVAYSENQALLGSNGLSLGFAYNGSEMLANPFNERGEIRGDSIIITSAPLLAIKQLIFAPSTFNPFKGPYAYLYRPENLQKLQKCNFFGIPFELDNNPKTQEWMVGVYLYGCLAGQRQRPLGDDSFHSWIIQQTAQKRSQVLMESDGQTIIRDKTPQDIKGYRRIATDHEVFNFAPQEPLGCGSFDIEWGYAGKAYRILEQSNAVTSHCYEDRWDDNVDDEANLERIEKLRMKVQTIIDRWLPALRGFR